MLTSISVLLIVGPKCTLAASHTDPGESRWVCAARSITVSKTRDRQTDRQTNGRTTDTRPLDAASLIRKCVRDVATACIPAGALHPSLCIHLQRKVEDCTAVAYVDCMYPTMEEAGKIHRPAANGREKVTQGKPSVAYVRSSDDIAFSLKTDTDVLTLTFDLLIPNNLICRTHRGTYVRQVWWF